MTLSNHLTEPLSPRGRRQAESLTSGKTRVKCQTHKSNGHAYCVPEIRIPAGAVRALQWDLGQPVSWRIEDGKLIVEAECTPKK